MAAQSWLQIGIIEAMGVTKNAQRICVCGSAPGTWSPFDICLLVDSLEDHVDTLDHGAKMILAG